MPGSSVPGREHPKPTILGYHPMTITWCLLALSTIPFLTAYLLPFLTRRIGSALGWYLRRKTEGRRTSLLEVMEEDEKAYLEKKTAGEKTLDGDWENVEAYAVGSSPNGQTGEKQWDGVVGFFHPFCNAGGGGERVLWAAIRATQKRWPRAKVVVYTGDHEAKKEAILDRVKSLGSIVLAWDALSLLVPDVFVDTMGYAFALGFCKLLFRHVPTGAYVHYPTISTDMLESLDPESAVGDQGVNAGQGTGARGVVKKLYWETFAKCYSFVGSTVDVVMTNSSWTQGHIKKLWGPWRKQKLPIAVVYPPCAVKELNQEIEVSEESEKSREKVILYIAQFRPEKNHQLILQSFADFVKTGSTAAKGAKLVLVGSVRDDHDSKRVYKLRLLVHELHIQDQVEFHLDASWPEILEWLRKASVGVNGMWNEHFGIGVVEYQASGLISVVHDSGGPKLDIVTEVDGEPTGFHATTPTEFAEGYEKALSLPDPLAVRRRARQSATRFTEEEFAKKWIEQMEKLVAMTA
ncbi:putative alpha- -mannosyltransferase alg11 protein [Phaeoacremonium minimum UCRPA7]|uniref:GDP-Man:Man(3)GlcNAc(2)-PP-Dol alpha-1,2-mannosyltransferase n=1 Tax=Phaeoacremonium minimum (strain UCR-PA7) TaxID=1286976 RepID=R8BW44_PHAM7|nr:putative alpha- -mannosyltransferase alg11 protein [Phaeoacremonium minimum UCRPA7]EOO03578.1 putative alpha- -mannosyltransferase alg11 protein [Phaeoacremonium minimum UCRPA7]